MINIIYGTKGSGKTKKIIDQANNDLQTAKGHTVFVSDTNRYMYDVKREVRFLNTNEYMIATADTLSAFICGLIGGNSDIEKIYIDGIARITNASLDTLKAFFEKLDAISATFDVSFVLTISCDKENLPPFLLKLA